MCFTQVFAVNTIAWDNVYICALICLLVQAMRLVKRNSWGHLYLTVRGEILGFVKDNLMRMHLPNMFLLIKSES